MPGIQTGRETQKSNRARERERERESERETEKRASTGRELVSGHRRRQRGVTALVRRRGRVDLGELRDAREDSGGSEDAPGEHEEVLSLQPA